jgi:hypothetical protein
MRGREFLELARELIKGRHERHRRGAAGRAYYALMLECRDALDAWGFALPRRDLIHAFVRDRFLNNANADLPAIGRALEKLVRLRNQADYELHGKVFPLASTIQQEINNADTALKLLDAINADANRRSAAVADIRAR